MDEQWTQEVFNELFKGKPVEDVTILDFQNLAREADKLLDEPKDWTFGKFVISLVSYRVILSQVRSFLTSIVNQMAISKMKIWQIFSTMREFYMVSASKIVMLMNMFSTEHPAAAFRARGTPGMYTFPYLIVWLYIFGCGSLGNNGASGDSEETNS